MTIHNSNAIIILTQKIRQPLGLTVMLDGNTNGIEEHKNDDKPVEPLGFHCVPNPKSEPFFGQPETLATALVPHFRFEKTYKCIISVIVENIGIQADAFSI